MGSEEKPDGIVADFGSVAIHGGYVAKVSVQRRHGKEGLDLRAYRPGMVGLRPTARGIRLEPSEWREVVELLRVALDSPEVAALPPAESERQEDLALGVAERARLLIAESMRLSRAAGRLLRGGVL